MTIDFWTNVWTWAAVALGFVLYHYFFLYEHKPTTFRIPTPEETERARLLGRWYTAAAIAVAGTFLVIFAIVWAKSG